MRGLKQLRSTRVINTGHAFTYMIINRRHIEAGLAEYVTHSTTTCGCRQVIHGGDLRRRMVNAEATLGE